MELKKWGEMRSKCDVSHSDGDRQPSSQKRIWVLDREAWLPRLCSYKMNISQAVKQSSTEIKTQLSNTETSPLTSMASSFVIEREENFAFAKCRQKPTTRRIFTFQTVGLLLIFQRSQSQRLTHTQSVSFLLHRQCQRGHLGQTVQTPKWEEQMITWAHLMLKFKLEQQKIFELKLPNN